MLHAESCVNSGARNHIPEATLDVLQVGMQVAPTCTLSYHILSNWEGTPNASITHVDLTPHSTVQ